MHVYTCTDFTGHWPVGTAAVIVAPDLDTAYALMARELKARFMKQDDVYTLQEVNLDVPGVDILRDGEYRYAS